MNQDNATRAAGSAAPACSLPPLPNKVILHTQPPDHYWYGDVYGYTEKQMRDYAKAAIVANNAVRGAAEPRTLNGLVGTEIERKTE